VAQWDLRGAELEAYTSTVAEPPDFDVFWERSLAGGPPGLRLDRVDTGLTAIDTWDATFDGFGGHPIRGWLHLPVGGAGGPLLPAVVQFQGYNGGRGLPHEHVLWALAGYAHFVTDTRGQGSGWTVGDTPDPAGSGPAQPGFLTRGVEHPDGHFYRRVFTDAAHAVAALRTHDAVDPQRIAVAGASQGGGIALAAAALVEGVSAVLVDVPFLCDIPRAVEITDTDPYAEVTRYLRAHRGARERTLATLAYFDGVHFARRAKAPALFSVALMDTICPPSTVYAAYNAYGGPKQIDVYPDDEHEGGGAAHQVRQLGWLRSLTP